MPTRKPSAPATAQDVFALLADRWNYAILREIFYGVQRFGALQRNLGIAPTTLTSRLAALVELGLVERHQYRPDKEWFDYRLTDSARGLVPAWVMLSQWAIAHLRTGDPEDSEQFEFKPRRRVRHTECGEITTIQLTCGCCGRPLDGRDLEAVELPADDPTEDSAEETAAAEVSSRSPAR